MTLGGGVVGWWVGVGSTFWAVQQSDEGKPWVPCYVCRFPPPRLPGHARRRRTPRPPPPSVLPPPRSLRPSPAPGPGARGGAGGGRGGARGRGEPPPPPKLAPDTTWTATPCRRSEPEGERFLPRSAWHRSGGTRLRLPTLKRIA